MAVLRTYATEFESERNLSAYRARGDERADGVVVVAGSKDEACERVHELLDSNHLEFEVENV